MGSVQLMGSGRWTTACRCSTTYSRTSGGWVHRDGPAPPTMFEPKESTRATKLTGTKPSLARIDYSSGQLILLQEPPRPLTPMPRETVTTYVQPASPAAASAPGSP